MDACCVINVKVKHIKNECILGTPDIMIKQDHPEDVYPTSLCEVLAMYPASPSEVFEMYPTFLSEPDRMTPLYYSVHLFSAEENSHI